MHLVMALSALSCLLKFRLVTPSKQGVAGWPLVPFTPSCRVDGSRESLEMKSIWDLGIGGWGSATPSSRVAGGVKVSVRGTPSSEGKGSWGGGGWVEKFSSPAGVKGRATVGGWMMARVVDARLEVSGGRLVSRARRRSVATCT